jgi:ketosteroid isomerase-like protein
VAEVSEIVRLAFERLNDDDLDGFLKLMHAEIEFHDVAEIPGSTVYRGHDGIRRWWSTVKESMEELRFEFGHATEAGAKLAVVTRAVGRGRGSGAAVDWTFSTVWGVRDELIDYHHGYGEHSEALRAIGAP